MPSVRKTYKYKLNPTAEQQRQMARTLGLCNWLYNTALDQRRIAWKFHRVSVTKGQQEAELPAIKDAFPEFADVHSQVLQDVLARLDKAYQAFFRRVQSGEKAGFPRFQGANRYHSFTYKQYENGARLDNGFLVLSKIGRVKVVWSRPIEGTPKTVTLSREADGWYVTFSCQDVPTQALPPTSKETGIDVGLTHFLTTAEGTQVANPRWLKKMEKQLTKCHQRVSRRKKGSKRRKKAVHLLQVAYQTVRRQRADYHHKVAVALVRQYDVIYHEALLIGNMVKNRHLAKSISDAAWGQFLSILTFKAVWAGRQVIAVPPAYTTQDCSNIMGGVVCGERVPKSLSMRTHMCPRCGYVADRDHNAAQNIQWAGQALRGLAG